MHVVGQRIVDRIDVRVAKQLLIGSVGFFDTQLLGGLLRPAKIARGDCISGARLRALDAGDDLFQADFRGRNDPPLDRLFRHAGILPMILRYAPQMA